MQSSFFAEALAGVVATGVTFGAAGTDEADVAARVRSVCFAGASVVATGAAVAAAGTAVATGTGVAAGIVPVAAGVAEPSPDRIASYTAPARPKKSL